MRSITELLQASRSGDPDAKAQIFSALYEDLRKIARKHLHAERWHPLQTTSLVNETFLKLAGQQALPFSDRAHLLATASRAMRQILVDHARADLALKRGSRPTLLQIDQLSEAELIEPMEHARLLALDDALRKLAGFNERMAMVVEMRFFGGLEFQEMEAVLDVSARTLKRDWRAARAFLHDAMQNEL
jgi:RNA polymerase sigma factor (TIGR02999 family)